MFKKIVLKSLLVLVIIVAIVSSTTGIADAYVNVKGYYRSNGTYVAPHPSYRGVRAPQKYKDEWKTI